MVVPTAARLSAAGRPFPRRHRLGFTLTRLTTGAVVSRATASLTVATFDERLPSLPRNLKLSLPTKFLDGVYLTLPPTWPSLPWRGLLTIVRATRSLSRSEQDSG